MPEPVQQVGVVAVTEEWLWIGPDNGRIEVRKHRDLILAADRRQYGADLRVSERGHEIGGTIAWRCAEASRRRVLHRLKRELLAQASHAELMHPRVHRRSGPRR